MGAPILEEHAYQQAWRVAWSGRPVPEAATIRAAAYSAGGVLLLGVAYAVEMLNAGILLLAASIAAAGPVIALHGQRYTEYLLAEDRFVVKTQPQQEAYDEIPLQGLVVQARPGIIGRRRGYVHLRLVPAEGRAIVLHGVPSIEAAIIMKTLEEWAEGEDLTTLFRKKQQALAGQLGCPREPEEEE